MNSATNMLTFSELIKKYRKEHGLTQTDFGKLINKKQVTVCNWEKEVHYPNDAEEIKLIANIINQPISVVVDAIQYGKKGIIEKNEPLLIELDKVVDYQELQERFKFLVDGKEVTGEELEKMLKLLKFERFNQNEEG